MIPHRLPTHERWFSSKRVRDLQAGDTSKCGLRHLLLIAQLNTVLSACNLHTKASALLYST